MIRYNITVKKIGCGLEHVRTNLRFFGLSLNFFLVFRTISLQLNQKTKIHLYTEIQVQTVLQIPDFKGWLWLFQYCKFDFANSTTSANFMSFLWMVFFCNRRYSLFSFGRPQLYNSEAMSFTFSVQLNAGFMYNDFKFQRQLPFILFYCYFALHFYLLLYSLQ